MERSSTGERRQMKQERVGWEIPTCVKRSQTGKGQLPSTHAPEPCPHTSELGAQECKPVGKTHPEVLANEAQKHKGSLSSANTEWAAATCSKALPQAPEGQRRMRCALPWCGAQSRLSVHSLRIPPPVRKPTNYRRRRNSFDSLVQFSKNKGNYYDLIENKTCGGRAGTNAVEVCLGTLHQGRSLSSAYKQEVLKTKMAKTFNGPVKCTGICCHAQGPEPNLRNPCCWKERTDSGKLSDLHTHTMYTHIQTHTFIHMNTHIYTYTHTIHIHMDGKPF